MNKDIKILFYGDMWITGQKKAILERLRATIDIVLSGGGIMKVFITSTIR